VSYARPMLDTYPHPDDLDADVLAATIDALSDCIQACDADTAADLSEQSVAEMIRCIRLCLDCIDVCTATAGAAATSASGTPAITRTVGSAPRPADAASRPAGTCCTF